ncbi:MAG TPA: TPM domain-containing protein [Methylomirabilota bacterium]|nr:TPM domain-containing protein [Methylomirabilota bacterium]
MRRAIAVLLLLLPAASVLAALPIPARPSGRVSDYAGALTPAERQRLEQKLAARERASSNQVAVAIFRSLQGESLEDYSIRLAQQWRIGQKGLDNGVIFLIFLEDRRWRLEVGYGLEATLTDALAASIGRDVFVPLMREGRLADAIAAALDAIDQAIAGTYRAPESSRPAAPALGPFEIVLLLIFLGGLAIVILPALFSAARYRRHGWTGGSTGWGGPYIGGGGWGGGGSSGGGNFGGGGGGFGGGGASGSW